MDVWKWMFGNGSLTKGAHFQTSEDYDTEPFGVFL